MDLRRYCSSLDDVHKKRYMEKISVLGIDPYYYLFMMDELSADISLFPKIVYPDIVNYLVTTKSAFTMEEMKAYKSFEAYNLATCGWVKKICVKHINSHILVIGKVMHPQRLNEKPLTPWITRWIISLEDGTILSAHCDCIAGLGEVCTHVAAVLFSIDDAMRKQDEQEEINKLQQVQHKFYLKKLMPESLAAFLVHLTTAQYEGMLSEL